jgi:hypothetical protein
VVLIFAFGSRSLSPKKVSYERYSYAIITTFDTTVLPLIEEYVSRFLNFQTPKFSFFETVKTQVTPVQP